VNTQQAKTYENYPLWIPALSWSVAISIDLLGAYILYRLMAVLPVFYLLFVLWLEYKLLKYHCVQCYYCGKTCGLGKGKLAAAIFRKADPPRLRERQVGWRDLITDFMVLILPVAAGTIYLLRKFDPVILALLVLLVLLCLGGNSSVRRNLVCKYCKQKQLGCPAEHFFNGTRCCP